MVYIKPTRVTVVNSGDLTLPTGAATASGQLAANTSLSSIDTKTPALVGGAVPISDNGGSITIDCRSSTPVYTWNRPADTTPYGAADVVGTASSANHQVTAAGQTSSLIQVISAELTINNTSVPTGMTTFRIHLWDSTPTAIADNAVFTVAAADRTKYCGYIDFPSIAAVGGGFLYTFGDYIGRPIRLSSTSFWFNLALSGAAGYTPASETEYSIRFHCVEAGA